MSTSQSASTEAAPAEAAPVAVVAGASGRTGRHIARQLVERGHVVRALTSDAERAAREVGDDLDWREVDVRDADAVEAAIEGADYVLSAIGASEWSGPNSPEFVDYGGNRNLIDAAAAAGVRHFVLVSSAAAGPHEDHADEPRMGRILHWKTEAELHLRRSGVPYTVIGPGGLSNAPSGGAGIRVTHRRDYRRAMIARQDVAWLAVEALTLPAARNKSFGAVNDAALPREAWRDDLERLPADAPQASP
jgi:uncharacterized protein YbjT (DUF2867 family)